MGIPLTDEQLKAADVCYSETATGNRSKLCKTMMQNVQKSKHAICWEAQNFFALKEDSPEVYSSGAKMRVVQVIPSQSSGTCCLTATTKCAGFPHIFSDLLHRQKGCSWFVDRMKHVNAGPLDPGDVPESEAPRAWWLSSASLASKGLGSRMSSSHRSGRYISRICKVSALVELPSHETAYSMFDEGANKRKGHFILGTSCSFSG